jgi:oxalate decarboxylase/phosphoglucose isomerase-like protein (cupin superfamily)
MLNSSVFECTLIDLGKIKNAAGNITVVEKRQQIPFDVKRIYYLYDVPSGEARGGHAHKKLQQLIFAASGSFDIIIDDANVKRTFHLSRPNIGLYMPAGLWRELDNFSSGSICMVLASHFYSEDDYIREYVEFEMFKNA